MNRRLAVALAPPPPSASWPRAWPDRRRGHPKNEIRIVGGEQFVKAGKFVKVDMRFEPTT